MTTSYTYVYSSLCVVYSSSTHGLETETIHQHYHIIQPVLITCVMTLWVSTIRYQITLYIYFITGIYYTSKPQNIRRARLYLVGDACGHYREGANEEKQQQQHQPLYTLHYNPRLSLRLSRPMVVAVFAFPILSWREACMFLQFYRLWRRLEFNTYSDADQWRDCVCVILHVWLICCRVIWALILFFRGSLTTRHFRLMLGSLWILLSISCSFFPHISSFF